jgi:leucyl aminopeptidase (aminopeptidase T)
MIPRKIGALPDQRGFNIGRGIYIMAVNKTAGVKKVKLGSSTRKVAAQKKAAPKKAAAMKKAASTTTTVLKKAVPKKTGAVQKAKPAPKKAATKKAMGPKLTATQHELLKRVVAHKGAMGYHTANKPEHRVLETLLKHKVIKKGPKHPQTNYFHYQVSTIGKKYLESGAVPKS